MKFDNKLEVIFELFWCLTSRKERIILVSRDAKVGLNVCTYHHWGAFLRGHGALTKCSKLDTSSFRPLLIDQMLGCVEVLLLTVGEPSGFTHITVAEDSADKGPGRVEPDCPSNAQLRVDHGFSAYANNCKANELA